MEKRGEGKRATINQTEKGNNKPKKGGKGQK
jgi:hypothetical protein